MRATLSHGAGLAPAVAAFLTDRYRTGYGAGVARPRTFDPDHAVDAAMQAFWRQGYEGTSLDDLTAACGIGRGSLYAAFGSKDALYLRALEHYQATEGDRVRACLTGDAPLADRVRALFERFASDGIDDPENRGCFVLNAAAERAPHDPATARRVREGLRAMEDALAGELEAAGHGDARALARYLVTALNGVRITAKATRDRAVVTDAIEIALRALA
jgi:TetR/AcrR family transcriptional repressor of nem operon